MKRASNVGLAVIVIGVVAAILAAAVSIFAVNVQSRISLNVGDGIFTARLANTPDLRAKGLSGLSDLSADQALIMAYPSDSKWQIWMKDMKVPIDILWLNQDKRIIYIVMNVSPDNGTDNVFEPKTDARYVIELPAGSVDNLNIKSGTTAVFDIGKTEVK
jgi:uncharacterized membrane protein (UPF0127 family)